MPAMVPIVAAVMLVNRLHRIVSDIVAPVEAEDAFDATNHATDGRADDRADRTGDTVAFTKTMRGAARDALGLRGNRQDERQQARAAKNQIQFHETVPFR
jgi:hypothetical protein